VRMTRRKPLENRTRRMTRRMTSEGAFTNQANPCIH
jgi:hypothetical protein